MERWDWLVLGHFAGRGWLVGWLVGWLLGEFWFSGRRVGDLLVEEVSHHDKW